MKKFFFFLLLVSTPVFADKVTLINGTVIEGKAVMVRGNNIIFDSFAGRIYIPFADVIKLKSDNPKIKLVKNEKSLKSLENKIRNKKHFNKNEREQMQKLSAGLLPFVRKNVYLQYRKRFAILYSGLGIVPGLGSWIQGDIFNAIFSESMVGGGIIFSQFTSDTSQIIAGLLIIVGELSSVIAPFSYQKKYNSFLKEALQPALSLQSKAGFHIPVLTLRF